MQFITIIYPETKTFQGSTPLVLVIIFSLFVGLFLSWPRPIEQAYSSPNTKISIIKGDILKQTTHMVIGACDTFDTAIPNIISRQSLQGQALDFLFGGDVNLLDRLLSDALRTKTIVGAIAKPGKKDKYGVGTIATIPHGARKLLFLAYTQMNSRNEANATADDVWKSLQALWDEVSATANGNPVSIPVIGGGQARLSSILPAQDSIRFIALSFMMASRKARVCDELRIVVRPQDYERLDRLEVQSFLSSLRAS
jgi:hypothetical protein